MNLLKNTLIITFDAMCTAFKFKAINIDFPSDSFITEYAKANMSIWIALLTTLLALPAQADIYKCRLANGKTEISNSPCPAGSGTVTVRPDDTVSEENRRQAERNVERMQSFVEKREAEQLADEKIEQERQAGERQLAAQQRVYESTSMENCLRELAQQSIDTQRRAELEAICRAKAKNEPTVIGVPVYGGGGAGTCIQNVMRLHLSPAEQNRRINQCQRVYHPAPLPSPLPPPHHEPKAENKPGKNACPRGDKYCVR